MKCRISISGHSGALGGRNVGMKEVPDADEAAAASRASQRDSRWGPEP